MSDDPWEDPSTQAWVRHVIEEMAPKLEDSAFCLSLVPDDREGDVKFWVELGASIMLDKPIVCVVFNDDPVPRLLRRVAEEIVRCERVNPDASGELTAAIHRTLARVERRRGRTR